MAVLRFHRDKRGYEYFSLVEPGGGRRGGGRLLYWFRTPPNVKLGRLPFDEGMQRAIEAKYPDVRFDWPRILATPIPSAEDEMWRERRRAAKAAKIAAREEDEESAPQPERAAEPERAVEPERAEVAGGGEAGPETPTPLDASDPAPQPPEASKEAGPAGAVVRRRRRRRRGRGGL